MGDYYHKTRNNMRKFIIFAALSVLLGSCAVNKPHAEQRRHHGYTVAEYEQKRSRLYDASLDLLEHIRLCAKHEVNDDWYDIDPLTRNIIEGFRVPSLEVLLNAVGQLENRQSVELADAYDDELCEYYEALKEYENLIGEDAL